MCKVCLGLTLKRLKALLHIKMFSNYEHKEVTYSCVVPNSNIFMKDKIFKLCTVNITKVTNFMNVTDTFILM
jgi:hypothetical protein